MLTETKEPQEPPERRDLEAENDSTGRSIGIGIACTLLFHAMLILLSPQFAFDKFSGVHTGINVANRSKAKSFDFQLSPGIQEPPPKPLQFVETNPDAPENTPDKTANFSNRNQQSAQPDPAKEKDPENRPSVKGQDDIKSDSIVTGSLAKPQQGAAAAPEVVKDDAKEKLEQKARAEQVPLSGFEKTEGKAEDGIATNVSKSKANSTQAEKAVEGVHDSKEAEGGLYASNQTAKAQPKARPRLTAPRTTILTNRAAGVSNVGILGRDARWSEYGEYLNEMLEIIQMQWYRILEESRVAPPRGSHVVITFKINSKGQTEITKVEDADSGKQGVFSCQSAITDPQPYRKWTDQMIALMGDEQSLTLSFYYQ